MSVVKLGALQDLSGNTDFDLTNNVINGSIVNASTRVATASLTDTSGNALINTVSKSLSFSTLNLGTAQNSTSGTSIDFTGIPSWARRITVMFNGVSTNGSSLLISRIGTSGGIETTGYTSTAANGVSTNQYVNNTGAFALTTGNNTTPSSIFSGSFIISLFGNNTWIMHGVLSEPNYGVGNFVAGSKSLSGTLDRVRITTVNGTDTFDAGSINIMWE